MKRRRYKTLCPICGGDKIHILNATDEYKCANCGHKWAIDSYI
jgi:ribosomal protein L37AE/L43A